MTRRYDATKTTAFNCDGTKPMIQGGDPEVKTEAYNRLRNIAWVSGAAVASAAGAEGALLRVNGFVQSVQIEIVMPK